MSEGRSWKDVMPCPRCGAPTDLSTIKLVTCTECDWDSNKSDHATRSDLSGIPTPMEQKWLDMIKVEQLRLEEHTDE